MSDVAPLAPLRPSSFRSTAGEFDEYGKPITKEGSSRYNNPVRRQKKGTFEKKVKVEEAPSLISVVNARSEIKERATAQVVERAKKKEEFRVSKARVSIQKPSPKPAKPVWTSVFSSDPNCLLSPSVRKAKVPSGYKPPPGSFKPDWSTAYQQIDLLSPTSGKPKMVAKQDLVLRDRILSPKKKTHLTDKKFSMPPSLDLDDNPDDEQGVEETRHTSPVKPSLSIDDDESSSGQGEEDDGEPAATGGPRAVTPPLDSDHATEKKVKQPSKVTEQLILEFVLPAEDGDFSDEEGVEVPIDLTNPDDLSSVGSWPSIASHDSHDTKMGKMMQRWLAVRGQEDELDDRTMYDSDVELEDNVLDHIALAVPDLEMAMDQFEEMTGIRPTEVGPLQGLGVKTAHIGLDGNRYLELLAPDLENPGSLGQELSELEKGVMVPYHYSIRSSELSRLIEGYVYDVLGWDPDHIAMVQALSDGSIRQWDILTMYGHDLGGVAPCYVRWKDPSHHPKRTLALKATLSSCKVRAPKGHKVHKLISGVGGLDASYGAPLLEVTLATPKGSFTFSSSNPMGLVFPEYDASQHENANLRDPTYEPIDENNDDS